MGKIIWVIFNFLISYQNIIRDRQLYNFKMSKIRKVYNLRKTTNIKAGNQLEQSKVNEQKEVLENNSRVLEIDKNLSSVSQNQREYHNRNQQEAVDQYTVQGQELTIDKLQLQFHAKIKDIQRKQVRIRNIGNSAIYIQFIFKNHPKLNNSGFKDPKPKFYCHYQNNVIKPGQERIFIFSFLSEFPGSFTEQVEINCQPSLQTKIPNLKLSGTSFINDLLQGKRKTLQSQLNQIVLKAEVQQILNDIVNSVRLPPPAKPNIKDPKIAQKQFEQKNKDLNLYYNAYLHVWFDQLYEQVCDKLNIEIADRYWDQSVAGLKKDIQISDKLDQVQKKCFLDRLEHYCYLSMTPLPNKSQLYGTVYQFVSQAAYSLGGDYVDAGRKELQMWEIPFRQPTENDTPEELKLRKEEVDKIKAEWVKKAKKKKWGEDQQKQLVNEFKKKVQQKTTENILSRFSNFEQNAEFIKARQFLKKSQFSLEEYNKDLQRLKTVKQCSLQGKKVLIKWNLKLKENCEEKLKELQEYLIKKKEEEKRLEEQKKNEGAKKKKAPAKPKKKGQKEEDEQKQLFFDFSSILQEQNWNGFLQTFKIILEKQPFLVLIGITYGPRSGRQIPQYSIQFLLEHLKTIQSSITFFPHKNLSHLEQKLQSQQISQGSILLLQNLNFLPYEVVQQQTVHLSAEGNVESVSKRKLLHPQIRNFFDQLGRSIDIIVNEDRYLKQISGFSAYLNKQVILGTLWWKYVGLSMRIKHSTVIFGDDFNPNNFVLLQRLVNTCSKLYLVGKVGLKFYMVMHKKQKIGNVLINKSEKEAIEFLIHYIQTKGLSGKIQIPEDFVLLKQSDQSAITYDGSSQNHEDYSPIDIGLATIDKLTKIQEGNLFVLGETAIKRKEKGLSDSLVHLFKFLYKKQEQKRQRHSSEGNQPSGINYNKDLVINLIGIDQALVQKIELKDKKVKFSQEEDGQQQQQEQGQSDKKKIELISDFRLHSLESIYQLWSGKFNIGLKDISKYQIINDD